MNYDKLSPMPERKTRFLKMFDYTRIVPEKAGCYILTDSKENILYIGKSGDLHRRLMRHLSEDEKAAYFFFWILRSKAEITALEIQWFRDYKRHNAGRIPRLNKQDPSN